MTRGNTNLINNPFDRLLKLHLQRQSKEINQKPADGHLDEDTLSIFVEGGLTTRESGSITSHLIGCDTCRRITASLVRLQIETEEKFITVNEPAQSPKKARDFFNKLSEKLFSQIDSAVFAHQEAEKVRIDSKSTQDDGTEKHFEETS